MDWEKYPITFGEDDIVVFITWFRVYLLFSLSRTVSLPGSPDQFCSTQPWHAALDGWKVPEPSYPISKTVNFIMK